MGNVQKISPCLWFDDRAEEAAALYTATFPRSRIVQIARFGEAGQEVHGRKPGSVMTVDFEWRDARTGEYIVRRREFSATESFVPARPSNERLELGQQAVVQELARAIVSEMRSSW